jgi:hypothetical protein
MQVRRLGFWHQSSTRHSERATKDTAHLHIDPTTATNLASASIAAEQGHSAHSLELGTTATYIRTRHDDTEGRLPYTEISEDYRSQYFTVSLRTPSLCKITQSAILLCYPWLGKPLIRDFKMVHHVRFS